MKKRKKHAAQPIEAAPEPDGIPLAFLGSSMDVYYAEPHQELSAFFETLRSHASLDNDWLDRAHRHLSECYEHRSNRDHREGYAKGQEYERNRIAKTAP